MAYNGVDSLEVRSSERGTWLLLRWHQKRLIAEFEAPDVSVATDVYLLGGCDGLDNFWCDLAKAWRGWKGMREWESLEGDLGLSATSDSLGHISLEVRIQEGSPFRWKVSAMLELDAGSLDRIASRARAFCAYSS